DSGFFYGDFRERAAQVVHVIVGHARHDCDQWRRNDVGGVQAAAQTDLEHRQLHAALTKREERGSSRHLEERHVVRGDVEHLVQVLHYLRVGDWLTINGDAFSEAIE